MFNDNYSLAKFGDRFGHLGDEETDAEEGGLSLSALMDEYGAPCVTGLITGDFSNCAAEVVEDAARAVCNYTGLGEDVCEVTAQLAKDYVDQKVEQWQGNEDGKPPSKEDTPEQTPEQKKETAKAAVQTIIDGVKNVRCDDLTDTQRETIAFALNSAQETFRLAGAMTEFDALLQQFTACDVKKELACTNEETQQTTFYAHPQCETKPSALKSWGVPILAGGGAGVAAWKLAKLTPTVSCLVGGVAFGATKYFIDKPKAS